MAARLPGTARPAPSSRLAVVPCFRKGDVAALGLLALATVGFFWRVVLAGEWMPAGGGDLASFLYPIYHFAARALQGGTVPLWNPYLYGGAPFAADIQASLFYPINLIVFLLAPQITYRTIMGLAIFHVWLAGVGAYLCFRDLFSRSAACSRTESWAAILPPLAGAIAFMFSDFFIIHFGNLNLIAQAAWLPFIFLFYHRALSQGRIGPAVWAGVCFGVAATAGHMQPLLLIVLVLALGAVYYLAVAWLRPSQALTADAASTPTAELSPNHKTNTNRRTAMILPVTALLLTVLIGTALATVALVPAYEMTAYTPRASYDYAQASQYSLPPAQLIGLLVPSFFGRDPARHWGAWDRVEVGYIGVLPLVLALLALLTRRDRQTGLLAVVAAVSLLAAMGGYAILHGWLYQLVPGLGGMRAPARFVFVMDFALAGLAAVGLDALMGRTEQCRRALSRMLRIAPWVVGALILFALPLAYHAVITNQDKDAVIFARTSAAANGLVFFAGLLTASVLLLYAAYRDWLRRAAVGALAAGLIFLDVASLGANIDVGSADPSRTFDHPAIISFLKSDGSLFRIDTRTNIWHLWQPDTPLLYDLYDVSGVVNPLILADYDRYLNSLPDRSSRLYDFLNAKYLIAGKDVVLDWQKFVPVFDGDPALNVYLNLGALPRALVVRRAIAVPDQAAAWAAVQSPDFDPSTTVVLESRAALDTAPHDHTSVSFREATIQFDLHALNELRLRVDMPADGYLVLSETWYPGWQAWVDGQPAPVLRANYAFRAVQLTSGHHEVRLTFAPSAWLIGLVVSLATIIGIAAGVVVMRKKNGPLATTEPALSLPKGDYHRHTQE
jgi:hypothetical protein